MQRCGSTAATAAAAAAYQRARTARGRRVVACAIRIRVAKGPEEIIKRGTESPQLVLHCERRPSPGTFLGGIGLHLALYGTQRGSDAGGAFDARAHHQLRRREEQAQAAVGIVVVVHGRTAANGRLKQAEQVERLYLGGKSSQARSSKVKSNKVKGSPVNKYSRTKCSFPDCAALFSCVNVCAAYRAVATGG